MPQGSRYGNTGSRPLGFQDEVADQEAYQKWLGTQEQAQEQANAPAAASQPQAPATPPVAAAAAPKVGGATPRQGLAPLPQFQAPPVPPPPPPLPVPPPPVVAAPPATPPGGGANDNLASMLDPGIHDWLGGSGEGDAPGSGYKTQLTGAPPGLSGSDYRDPIAQDDPARLAEIQKQYGPTPNDIGYTGPDAPAVYSERWLASPAGQEYAAQQAQARAAEAAAGGTTPPDTGTPPPDETGEPPATGGGDPPPSSGAPYRAFQNGSYGTFDPATGTFTPEAEEGGAGGQNEGGQEEPPAPGEDPEFDTFLEDFIRNQMETPGRYDKPLVQEGQQVIKDQIDRSRTDARRILEEHHASRGLTGSTIESNDLTNLLGQFAEQERQQLFELGREQATTNAADVQAAGNLGISAAQLQQNRYQMLSDATFRNAVEKRQAAGQTFDQAMRSTEFDYDKAKYGEDFAYRKQQDAALMDWMYASVGIDNGDTPAGEFDADSPDGTGPTGSPLPPGATGNETVDILNTGWRPPNWDTWSRERKGAYLMAAGMTGVQSQNWLARNEP